MTESSDANAAFLAVLMRDRGHLTTYDDLPTPTAGQPGPSRRIKPSCHRRSTREVTGKQAFVKDPSPRSATGARVRRSPVVNHDTVSSSSKKASRDDMTRGRRRGSETACHHTHDEYPPSWLSTATLAPWVSAESLRSRPTTPSTASSPQMPLLSPSGWSTDTDTDSDIFSLDDWGSDDVDVVEVPADEIEKMFSMYINAELCLNE
ncbi:uncharacterized protein SCHCODRAFT_02663345 [Schizophyllum commune H4-8]|uniref:Uncharacterized protein n=1 Tax=Schizophyllum commune (strain H4-8 / FGSC 9210) TaxID=578458 RepID=D8PP71_SCHCM|nr:uncharacterized protein SCHCODRAFT_02663345 [Schizophyllum commune H4-8]KAI5898450.1 hypothetical protein SCHCODRAFT_02663345 [Schizophyllum commune H4-8]